MYMKLIYNGFMFDRCLYFNINAMARKVNKVWEHAFQKLALSPSHAYLLRAVLAQPGMRQKELADELSLSPATVTRFIDAMAAQGLVERKVTDDGREAQIYATKRAHALHRDLEKTGQALYAKMRDTLGEKKFDSLVKSLRQGRRVLSEDRSPHS